jgi:hypothetical protein
MLYSFFKEDRNKTGLPDDQFFFLQENAKKSKPAANRTALDWVEKILVIIVNVKA